MSNLLTYLSLDQNRNEIVAESFNKLAEKYLSTRLSPEIIREKDRILGLLGRGSKYDRVLDLGCGPGTMTEDLSHISNKVWGMDISKEMIKIANARFAGSEYKDRVHFETCNALNLKFPNEYFDAVICIGVLRYLKSWQQALEQIYRVLKPGGLVVMTFYYRFSPQWFSMCCFSRPLLLLTSLLKRRGMKEYFSCYEANPLPFSYRKFERVFFEIGFSNLEVLHSGFTVSPFNRVFPRLSTYIYLKLESSFFNSKILGWIGSVCIAKGLKK